MKKLTTTILGTGLVFGVLTACGTVERPVDEPSEDLVPTVVPTEAETTEIRPEDTALPCIDWERVAPELTGHCWWFEDLWHDEPVTRAEMEAFQRFYNEYWDCAEVISEALDDMEYYENPTEGQLHCEAILYDRDELTLSDLRDD